MKIVTGKNYSTKIPTSPEMTAVWTDGATLKLKTKKKSVQQRKQSSEKTYSLQNGRKYFTVSNQKRGKRSKFVKNYRNLIPRK